MREIIFTIDRLEFVGNSKFMVAGRNCGDELRIGDLVKLKDSGKYYDVTLEISEIRCYNHDVEALSSGLTGSVYFNNEHASYFNLGAKLVGQNT